MPRKSDVITHKTKGSVMDDLNIAPEVLASFNLRAQLHSDILELASKYSQAELQNILHEPQPRISDLMRRKTMRFSLETLMIYSLKLGMNPKLTTTTGKKEHTHQLVAVGAA
jgi:predicted XRE-type DNA-binding protein